MRALFWLFLLVSASTYAQTIPDQQRTCPYGWQMPVQSADKACADASQHETLMRDGFSYLITAYNAALVPNLTQDNPESTETYPETVPLVLDTLKTPEKTIETAYDHLLTYQVCAKSLCERLYATCAVPNAVGLGSASGFPGACQALSDALMPIQAAKATYAARENVKTVKFYGLRRYFAAKTAELTENYVRRPLQLAVNALNAAVSRVTGLVRDPV